MERLVAKMPAAALVIYFAHSVTYGCGLMCSIQLVWARIRSICGALTCAHLRRYARHCAQQMLLPWGYDGLKLNIR